ncbi:MAG TPA: hypothetical protein VGS58_09045 [Candidatus Sulfopaludibacter sp.]|nr:hypothetical protein [Candidatus Sulfopaludibacter sp.]
MDEGESAANHSVACEHCAEMRVECVQRLRGGRSGDLCEDGRCGKREQSGREEKP